MKGRYKTFIGLFFTVVFVVISFGNIDFESVGGLIARSNPVFIVIASVFYMSSFVPRALRWKVIMRKRRDVKIRKSFSYVLIGWMGNNIFPARAGEVLRAYVSGAKERIGTSFSLATILVERIFDVLTLTLFLVSMALIAPFPSWVRDAVTCASFVLMLGIAALFLIVRLRGGPLRKVNILKKKMDSFIDGIRSTDKRAYPLILILSIISWLFEVMTFYSVGIATGINISIFAAAFALVVVNLGIVIPSSPGYVGTFHFFCILALGLFGIGQQAAMGFAILVHLAEYIPTTLSGLFLLQKEGLSISKMSDKI